MKHLFITATLALASLGAMAQTTQPGKPAAAATAAAPAPSTQQNKMKTCNADAKTKALQGDERKSFMKSCLSAKRPAA